MMNDAKADDSAETRRLLERLQAGDATAFAVLCERHRPLLLEFLRHRFDPRLRARADPSDVVQETQMEAYRRLDDFLARRPMPFHLWLRKTAYERLRMLERRHLEADRRATDREARLPSASSSALARRLVSPGTQPSQAMERAERAARVRRALARLPAEDREMLLMRTYEELPYEEIAVLLDITSAAARKRHGRALVRLSQLLNEEGLGGSASD
jgi:RNA polymerase sigma-70 factor (ECF subfamily)